VKTDVGILHSLIRNAKAKEKDPLTPLIDEYLIKRDLPKYQSRRVPVLEIPVIDRARPMGRLSPSSMCGCQRETIFRFTGVSGSRRRINPDMELIFDDGKWRHHKWGWIFKDMEAVLGKHRFRLIELEGRCLYPDMFIAGHLDALIRIKVDGEWVRYIVDFKGANNWAFENVFRKGAPIDKHIYQLATYCMMRKIDRGILLYDNKNDQRYKVFPILMEAKHTAEILAWAREVIDSMEDEVLPPLDPECKGGTFLYERCRYTPLCYGTMNDAELTNYAYSEFTSTTALWKRGMKIEDES
jgi:hypothetical protein